MERIYLKLDKALADQVHSAAATRGVPPTTLVRDCLRIGLSLTRSLDLYAPEAPSRHISPKDIRHGRA